MKIYKLLEWAGCCSLYNIFWFYFDVASCCTYVTLAILASVNCLLKSYGGFVPERERTVSNMYSGCLTGRVKMRLRFSRRDSRETVAWMKGSCLTRCLRDPTIRPSTNTAKNSHKTRFQIYSQPGPPKEKKNS